MSLQDTKVHMVKIRQDSIELQNRMMTSASILTSQSHDIWETTRGSQTGNTAAQKISRAAEALTKSSQSLRALNSEIDRWLAAQ
jgi:hypothetical protein